MHPVNVLSLALALSAVSLAAPTPYSSGSGSQLAARGSDLQPTARGLALEEDAFNTLASRAWTRSQEAELQAAAREYARLNALRGTEHFDQQAWLAAQTRYNQLRAAKTAEENKKGSQSRRHSRSLEEDENDNDLAARAWTRSQEAALQEAAREYARLNALRGTEHFDHDAWLAAQTRYNQLQAAKTADANKKGNQSKSGGSRRHSRSLEDDEEDYSLAARAWTRSQEAALQEAAREYARLNALRGTEHFDHDAWLAAQTRYNQLQAAKTADANKKGNQSKSGGSRRHSRSLEVDDEGYSLAARAWTRSQEAELQAAAREYARLNALRGTEHFDQQAWLAAQTRYNQLRAAKTAEENKKGSQSRRHSRSIEKDDGDNDLAARAWTRAQEAALQEAAREYARLNALRGTEHFDQQAWLAAQTRYNQLRAAKTAEENKKGSQSRRHSRSIEDDEEDSSLAARAWTRAQEAELQAAAREYARLNAQRGTEHFDQQAWLAAQTRYNQLRAAKTAEENKKGSQSRRHSRSFDDENNLDELD